MKGAEKYIIIACLLILFRVGHSQTVRDYRMAFHLEVDNDAFVPPAYDRYYSSGVRFNYRRILNDSSRVYRWLTGKKGTQKKVIYQLGLGHHMYTPISIGFDNVALFDRPYAGWVYASAGFNFYYNEKSALFTYLDIGATGEITGVGNLQEWFHEVIPFPDPEGWEYEIRNGAAVNLKVKYLRRLMNLNDNLDIISESTVQIGTILNNLRQAATLRLFQPLSLDQSVYTNAKLGEGLSKSLRKSGEKKLKEFYLYYTYEFEYVIHNTLIEGYFYGDESVHTEAIEPLVHHHTVGLAFGGIATDWKFAIQRNTPETKEAIGHTFGKIEIVTRF